MADNIDDDEYVANLLKQDAADATKQYKMVGLDAFKPARARSGAPKPNTRFLRHIIRETDSHNTALLAKEAEESRARLKRLERVQERETRAKDVGRLTPPALTDEEHDYRKRKRPEHQYVEEDENRQSRKRKTTHRDTEHRSSRWKRDGESGRRRRRDRSRESSEHDSDRRAKRPSRHGKDRQRSRSNHVEEHRSHRDGASSRRRRRRRSYSRTPSRSPSPARSRRHHGARKERTNHQHSHEDLSLSPERNHQKTRKPRTEREPRSESPVPNYDSDPLEALVGPLPPPAQPTVRARGRGAYKVNSMAMDARFSSTYNPSADVRLQSDNEDEWGDALEALKDRQRWKQQGADRLKAAGFTEDQIQKWEKGDEKTEEDVTWATKGQREWDRGKVLDQEGEVDLKADWGRLK